MTKILIATGLFPPDIGGPATYSKILLEELPKRGIEVSVLPFGTVRNLPRLIRHLAYFGAVIRRSRDCDLIYAQDPVSVGLPACLAALLLRKPFLVRIAGDYAWEQGVQRFAVTATLDEFSKEKKFTLPVRILRYIERFVARRAERIIVPSHYLKHIVSQWGVSVRRITVIYSVFDGVETLESKESLRHKLELTGTVLISAGRLVPWKGFAELIATVPALQETFSDLRLLIVGDGPEKQKLETLITERHLGHRVSLLGRLPQSVLLNYIRASDLFVLNTSYEGFSHQLLEVMALETPVLTTAVGGNIELIEHERSGLLFEPNDLDAIVSAVKKVLTNASFRQHIVEGGSRRIKDFTRGGMIEELVAEFKRV